MFKFNDKNKKFGKGIYSFSIDRLRSCRGASEVCKQICYAAFNRFVWQPFLISYLNNYYLSMRADFAHVMLASLSGKHPVAFRIHDVGDLYSVHYIRKWLTIVRARPDIQFFAFTRAWTLPELVPELMQLAAEPNMTLLLSLDNSMPCDQIPMELVDLPRAWLATSDDDIPPVHLNVDLVFRNLRLRLTRLENLKHFGAMVCPAETGRGKATCSTCKFCWLRWKQKHARGCERNTTTNLITIDREFVIP